MPYLTVAATYFVVWWISLFLVLPLRPHNQVDAGEVVHGSEPGAPVLPRILPKLLINTVVAAVITALLLWGLSNPVLLRYWS